MKVAIYTLGCKVNQYETQAMEQSLRARGHEVVDFSDAADAYVVNTCSVTAVSDQKSRQVLHRARREHPGAVVAVCGCYPQTHADDVRKLDVDLIAGTGDRTGFIGLLEQAVAEKRRLEAIDKSFERRVFEVLPAGGMTERTRAMLKVEDGCVNFCTYCIIPYARGPIRSLPLEQAKDQAAHLAAEGYQVKDAAQVELTVLTAAEEKALIKQLAQYPVVVQLAARDYDPSFINRYLTELAAAFHKFYNACRIKGAAETVLLARLKLADTARAVLKNGMTLIGCSAPEKM